MCMHTCSVAKLYSTFCDPMTISHQDPLSMGFSSQEFWSGLPFSSPRELPDPGIEPASPALAGRFFTTEPPGKLYPLCLSLNNNLFICIFHWIYQITLKYTIIIFLTLRLSNWFKATQLIEGRKARSACLWRPHPQSPRHHHTSTQHMWHRGPRISTMIPQLWEAPCMVFHETATYQSQVLCSIQGKWPLPPATLLQAVRQSRSILAHVEASEVLEKKLLYRGGYVSLWITTVSNMEAGN